MVTDNMVECKEAIYNLQRYTYNHIFKHFEMF